MDERHLSEEEIRGVGRGEEGAVRRWLRHAALTGCAECLALCQPLLEAGMQEEAPAETLEVEVDGRYDEAVARAVERASARLPRLARFQARAAEVRAFLATLPERHELDPLLALSSSKLRRLVGWPSIEIQLEASFALRYSDPAGMEALAEWAVLSARHLSPRLYGPALVADYQARTWIELANAHRVNDNFPSAEKALNKAAELFQDGSGDVSVYTRLLDVKASLRADQRRFTEAFQSLDLVERLYRDINDLHLAGRALVSRGNNLIYAGEPREALRTFARAEPLLDRQRDPELFLSCRLSRLRGLVDSRRFPEALELAQDVDFKQLFAADPLNLAMVRWTEGLLFAGTGDDGQAEQAFEEAGSIFLKTEKYFDAALVNLELAAVWLRQGKVKDVAEISETLVEVFEVHAIHREALVALRYFQEACRFQCVTAETVAMVKGFLERLEKEPGERFPLP